uniref:hemopexin repeat-containing protein n=1 Tax=uncultured Ornithinimicrobium sp. TaxID=259307 RepID=UPI002593FD09
AALHSGSKTYFFSGDRYIRVTRGDTGPGTVDPGYPAWIRSGWGWHRQPRDVISFSVSECVYGWTARYRQEGTHVTVRIRLDPDDGISATTMDTLRTRWRDGIRDTWSERFDCRGPEYSRQLCTFDVQWVDTDPHHTVRVRPGPERSNMTTWDTDDTADVAAHEFGHMLGHPDEYPSSACPDRDPVDTGTVMDDNTETVARLYERITAFHGAGHVPVAGAPRPGQPGEPGEAEQPGEPGEPGEPGQPGEPAGSDDARPEGRMTNQIDDLEPARRDAVLESLRRRGRGEATTGPDDADVVFEVVGGAPGERYSYRISVRADGVADRRVLDQMRAEEAPDVTERLGADVVRQVFRAVDDAGLLSDAPPQMVQSATGLVPDSMVAVLTVREGDSVRRIVVPAGDPSDAEPVLPGEPRELPLETPMQLPSAAVDRLAPVLDALHLVEERFMPGS